MPHVHEKVDFTATVYIVNEGAVLLRYHDKYDFWVAVGGHIELDEDPVQAAIREAKEEAGLDITLVGEVAKLSEGEGYQELLPPRFMNRHRINNTHEHVDNIFFATSKTREVRPAEGEKDVETKWFTREDLDNPTFGLKETVRFYASAALDSTK